MRKSALTYTLAIVCGILLVGGGYLAWQYVTLNDRIESLLQERNFFLLQHASTTNTLNSERALSVTTIADLSYRLSETEDDLRQERNRNEAFEDQIRDLAGTVNVLDRLAKTDRELLQKYSRVYFLNENYIPERLTQIDQSYVLPGKKDQYFHASALRFLKDMIERAKRDGIDLKVVSAYRSFDEQNELKGQFTQVYGSGANAFSADQGFSEHQLGTTVDLTDPATGGTFASFANTDAYRWLLENAHRYGFVLSYPENNQFYIFEPWHWRFVGRDLARDLNRSGNYFYDWEQRKIDEYLVEIFE